MEPEETPAPLQSNRPLPDPGQTVRPTALEFVDAQAMAPPSVPAGAGAGVFDLPSVLANIPLPSRQTLSSVRGRETPGPNSKAVPTSSGATRGTRTPASAVASRARATSPAHPLLASGFAPSPVARPSTRVTPAHSEGVISTPGKPGSDVDASFSVVTSPVDSAGGGAGIIAAQVDAFLGQTPLAPHKDRKRQASQLPSAGRSKRSAAHGQTPASTGLAGRIPATEKGKGKEVANTPPLSGPSGWEPPPSVGMASPGPVAFPPEMLCANMLAGYRVKHGAWREEIEASNVAVRAQFEKAVGREEQVAVLLLSAHEALWVTECFVQIGESNSPSCPGVWRWGGAETCGVA